ncbi:WD40-repeat-containing domain protein [Russula vinacea]|nr:WD40-repeat-containing domain protein [Russula vinacea]
MFRNGRRCDGSDGDFWVWEAPRKRQLDAARFDKAKREEVSTPPPAQGRGQDAGPSLTAANLPLPPGVSVLQARMLTLRRPPPLRQPLGQGNLLQKSQSTTQMRSMASLVVSALALDPSGARVLSGSHDYDCKLWDFGGMDHRCKPFKSWEPAESYHIHDLKYSPDGQHFLVVSGTTQAKLYDRDGEEKATFIKGDPYIRDMKNTAGHVSELSSCAWHPKDMQTFITGSADSTIRIWNVENKRKQKTVIVVKSKERGARTKVTTCGYSPDGRYIAGACLDGSLHLWKTNSNFVRPDITTQYAHDKGTETGSLAFSVDGNTILTRGGDDTVKLWDIRSFKQHVAKRSGARTLYPSTNAIFSPDNKHIVTGTGGSEKGGHGALLFLSRQNLDVVKELDVGATPVVVQWHPKINQIVVGLTTGALSVLYSPQTSLNGAKLLLNKGPAKRPTIEDMSDAAAAPAIIIPGVTRDGEFTSGLPNKRKRDKDRQDPRKSRRPEMPVHGPGRGGRVGASATQHVVQNLVRDTTRDEDEIAWFDRMLIYGMPEYGQTHWFKVSSSGKRVPKGVAAVLRAAGHQATSHVANFRESSWRRNLGTARGCGVMAGLEPWHGPPTPIFPREALLKYAKSGDEDLQWTAAWRINQPKPVFAEEVEEKDEDQGE